MSSQQDRPGRGRAASGHEEGKSIAIGAAVGSIAGLLWAVLRRKKTLGGGDDDSPIIIKSGSLEVCLQDGIKGDIVEMKGDHYQVTSDAMTGTAHWDVSVIELISGCPVNRSAFSDVTRVVLDVVDEDGASVDTITITFETDSLGSTGKKVLLVAATQDKQFGRNTLDRSIKRSKKHPRRAVSTDINTKKNIGVGSVTVAYTGGKPETFSTGDDYTLACTFRK